jgi:acyl carrier protein
MTFSALPEEHERRATDAEIAARIEAFIRHRFRVPPDDAWFTRGANLWEQGYVDSTGVVDLIAHLEHTFGVALPDEVLFDPSFATIDGMAAIVGACTTRRDRCSSDSATTTSATDPS